MRNREIEKRLTQAVSNSVPNVLDDILIKCEKKRGFEKKVIKKKEKIPNQEKFRFRPVLVGTLAFILLFTLSLMGINQYNKTYKVASTIEFDVNPSIELEINEKEKIIKANALNDEAKKVLADMDFKGVDLDIAVNAIIGSMLKNGYITIDNNSILVSVKNNDKEKGQQLQARLSKDIDEILKTSGVDGSIITLLYEEDDELLKLANDNNISEGKAKLINNIINLNLKDHNGNLYTVASLSKLSINELKLLLQEKETTLKNVNTSGTASSSSYIGKDKAKEIAFAKAGVKEKDAFDIEVVLDADDGQLVYDIEFKTKTKEYEYEVDAKTGTLVYSEIDVNDDYYEEADDNQKTNNNKNNNQNTNKENNKNSNPTIYIGKDKAKSIAFSNAGVSSSKVRDLSVEFDEDDGIYYYEIEFKANNKEYNYEINAKTGKIIDKEIENDD